jgi:hypothetical protein
MNVMEIQYVEIQREADIGNAMVFHQPLLGPAPKSLQAIE